MTLTQTDLENPLELEFATGQAVVYTHRSPDKTSGNEDCAAIIPYDRNSGILVIADGLGGQPGGDTASKTAIECLTIAIDEAAKQQYSLRDAILDGIEHANEKIIGQSNGSATTIAIIELQDQEIRPYHIGDSMLMAVGQRGKKKLQTVAHSPVGYAVESGLLDVNEAVHHEERHLVSNVVGSTEMRIEIGATLTLDKRDTVIVASDGLFDNLYIDEITEIIRKGPLPTAARRLVEIAHQRMKTEQPNLPSHPDDLTFIIYRSR